MDYIWNTRNWQVKQFNFSLSQRYGLREVESRISEMLNSKRKLEININWNEANGDINSELQKVAFCLSQIAGIVHLNLNFNNHVLNQDGCRAVYELVASLPYLMQYTLRLRNTELNDASLISICDSLSLLTNLRELELDISRNIVSGTTLSRIGSFLSAGRSLLTLHLTFSISIFPNTAFIKLADAISQHKQLFELTMLHEKKENVPEAQHALSDEGGVYFANTISSLKSLKRLNLDFSRCPKLTGATLAALPPCESPLTKLHLNFTEIYLDQTTVMPFAQRLAKLSQVNNILLNFSQTSFTNNLVLFIINALNSLQELSSLYLYLQDCPYIDDGTAVNIANLLRSTKKVNDFHLWVPGTEITAYGKSTIEKLKSERKFFTFKISS
eukprot:TRINITY_DN5080_c0_g1_i4.p1 TRINITY_DN5080_c0_g1~~TRINITY_DN5080_c0_g1_i4.p1  ORF type:complete len:386 (-),score=33.86 TRINITY_DN5080_c0_g1_i4:64-1221(-)